MSFWEDFKRAYQNEIGVGQDESSLAMFQAREAQEKSPQATRGAQLAEHIEQGKRLELLWVFHRRKRSNRLVMT